MFTHPFDPTNSSSLSLSPCTENDEEEDLSGLHPGALLYRSVAMQNFPLMADALAHGANVNWVNVAEDSKTPLIQAAMVVSVCVCVCVCVRERTSLLFMI